MQWNDHSRDVPEGAHAFLSPSSYHWLNYDDEKVVQVYRTRLATLRGTELHAFAQQCIRLGQKLPKSKKTLNMYVNDAIGFKMRPEQPLYFSPNCFGTSDAIAFRQSLLRIHDLKTGITPASMRQLEIYAALFCLEYDIRPGDIDFELRIYQNDEVVQSNPDVEIILPIMDKIIRFDRCIEQIKKEEELYL